MATITVKNIPDELYARLKMYAEANHRSINSEIIVCIEKAILPQKIRPEEALVEARALRERTRKYEITEDEFTQIKNAGRS